MKVLFFLPYSQAAGCRYRVHQYLPYLHSQGVTCDVRELITPPLYDILYQPGHRLKKAALFTARALSRLRDLVDASDHDLFFIYRECFPFGPALLERYLRRLGKPIVFDFDDAIYLPDPDPLKNALLLEVLKAAVERRPGPALSPRPASAARPAARATVTGIAMALVLALGLTATPACRQQAPETPAAASSPAPRARPRPPAPPPPLPRRRP